MKSKIFLFLILLTFCITLVPTSYVSVFAQNETPTEQTETQEPQPEPSEETPVEDYSIDNLAKLKAINGKNNQYYLTADITIEAPTEPAETENYLVSTFNGTFDGNGYKIIINDQNIVSVFQNLNAATIKDLKIEKYVAIAENATSVTGNVGAIAQTAENSYFEQCYINYNTTKDGEKLSYTEKLSSSSTTYVGAVVGYSKNCQISNCLIDADFIVTQTNPSATETYLGGVVGNAESTQIYNTICTADLTLTHNEQANTTKMFVGGIIGYLQGKTTVFSNSIYNGTFGTSNVTKGLFVGGIVDNASQIPSVNNNGYLKGLVSCCSQNELPIGEPNSYILASDCIRVGENITDYNRENTYQSDFWDILHNWNFTEKWELSTYALELQPFMAFDVNVDTNVANHELSGSAVPQNQVLTLKLYTEYNTQEEATETENVEVANGESVKYGSKLFIVAKFNKINEMNFGYDFFFKINKLKLLDDGEVKGTTFYEIERTDANNNQTKEFVWEIPSLNAAKSGTYVVTLDKISYNIEFAAPEHDGLQEGNIKTTGTNSSATTITKTLSYGANCSIDSLPERFFISNKWEIAYKTANPDYTEGGDEEEFLETPINVTFGATENSMITNERFAFNFVENDTFVKKYVLDSATDYIIDEITQNEIKTNVLFKIINYFTSEYRYIEFKVNLDGQTVSPVLLGITYKINEETIIASTEEAYKDRYVKKVAIGSLKVYFEGINLTLYNLADSPVKDDGTTSYSLDSNSGFNFVVEKVSENQDTPITFTLYLNTIVEPAKDYTIWWILGGSALGIGIIVLIIIIIKKSSNTSYRSFY